MTNKEIEKCIKLMEDGISHGRLAKANFDGLNRSQIGNQTKELQGQNWLGYAQGVNQVLVSIGFKHPRMKELQELI